MTKPVQASLVVTLEDEELVLPVRASLRVRACLEEGWWVFPTTDGRQLAWPADQVVRVEFTATPNAPPEP